ncbi:hypothetical protein ACIQYL_25520 [Lysinibacillus xylanilyticus]|uniref:hypothetical protein n=1 Tax=Lysinibacillus xylanilyticus TaxID=582475 RepID=UPI00381AD173
MLTTIIIFLSSMKIAIILLFIFSVLGAIEGIVEEYFKFMDKKAKEASEQRTGQSMDQEVESSFWTKQRAYRFLYKYLRMIIILIILCTTIYSTLNVIIVIKTGGFANINWNYVILIPAFKIYKAFTKVMSDVVNETDEAASDVSKVHTGYNTAFKVYEKLRTLNSTETEKETKNSTNNKDDKTQE